MHKNPCSIKSFFGNTEIAGNLPAFTREQVHHYQGDDTVSLSPILRWTNEFAKCKYVLSREYVIVVKCSCVSLFCGSVQIQSIKPVSVECPLFPLKSMGAEGAQHYSGGTHHLTANL